MCAHEPCYLVATSSFFIPSLSSWSLCETPSPGNLFSDPFLLPGKAVDTFINQIRDNLGSKVYIGLFGVCEDLQRQPDLRGQYLAFECIAAPNQGTHPVCLDAPGPLVQGWHHPQAILVGTFSQLKLPLPK